MKTISLQIGNSDDKLTQAQWAEFVNGIMQPIEALAEQIHFFGGSPNWYKWQNAAWIFVASEANAERIKEYVTATRAKFSQDSAAWLEGETSFI